ncbi:hypothetical protein QA641_29140 [Bradyrhizobium sp. CB1650]|uniref:hypothetical protein n=1 Tax=Bradyrhizobium sp. CB1650 TaxID=3039153 RepID=UPI002434B0B9|nr:hypothetical protein [Bradyrhizobium sp. CB1650]WGD49681.1 hypothetical protein QA641_29140 [Bradyrhizobium sp. CB1650]
MVVTVFIGSVLKRLSDNEYLDLIEMRRQLTALRSQNSDNRLVTTLLNRFLVKIALLSGPKDRAHEQHLRAEFARTLERVEAIALRRSSSRRTAAIKPSK